MAEAGYQCAGPEEAAWLLEAIGEHALFASQDMPSVWNSEFVGGPNFSCPDSVRIANFSRQIIRFIREARFSRNKEFEFLVWVDFLATKNSIYSRGSIFSLQEIQFFVISCPDSSG